jgi:Flp pilus assembly protein CpaB
LAAMGDSLNPSALSRLTDALRPDWSRTVAARRAAAGALVVLAAVAALRPDPDDDRTVVVATRDLAPGVELSADDVRLETRTATTVPDGSLADPAAVVGATLAGPARRGETITDVRVLGPRLAESSAGPNARIVPLHLDDTALLDLIRPGDVVDVLAATATGTDVDGEPRVVATDAVVVMVSAKAGGPGRDSERVLLVALPGHAANAVAAAALVQTVTVTFH